jgi:hypothetical protein
MTYYVIFNKSELGLVDFNQTMQSNSNHLRYDINNEMTFVKWEGATPAFVELLSTKTGIYDHDAMMLQLQGAIWQTGVVPPQ